MNMLIRYCSLFLILCLALTGCSQQEEKSETDKRREQRESEWQQRLSKKGVKTDAELTYGPEMRLDTGKDSSESPREMKIAVIGPETGELSEYGTKTLEGVLLAAEKINASGGILGKKVEVIHYDSKGGTKEASIATAKIMKERVIAVIGSPTGEITFNAPQMANTHHTVFLSAGTRRRLGDSGPYIFRNTLTDDVAIKRIMEYAFKEGGYRDLALVTSMSNDYSIQLSALFKNEIIERGGNLVADISLWSKETANVKEAEMSLKDQVKEIKTKRPQAIIYTGEAEEGAQLMIEAKRQGLKVPMIGGEDLFSYGFIDLGKDAVLGSILYTGYAPDWEDEHLKGFIREYKNKKGKAPDKVVALGYDAFNIIAKAIADAGSTNPAKVRDTLMNMKGFTGVTGVMSFTENREPVKSPFLYKVTKDGDSEKFSLIGTP
ncbi:MAG: ABC transporter substrate-binding protein [Nitrospirae bacterium]|nr:ABC transporter substrate-binding protein [Nitrospirota bacterium]